MSPPVRLPLVRFAARKSVVSNRLVGSWFPTPASSLVVSNGHRAVSTDYRSPLACASGFILSSSTPLQSSPVPCPLHASQRRAPSLGLAFPLRDFSRQQRYDEDPSPSPSVLGVSHAPDGLLRSRPRGFVSPRSHVQGSPSRRSFRTAESARRRPVPSRRWRSFAAPVARRSTSLRPALRALFRARDPVP